LLEGSGGEDIFVAHFNDNHSLDWARAVGGAGNDWPTSVALTPDGKQAVVVGCFEQQVTFGTVPPTTLTSTGGADMFVACYVTSVTQSFASIAADDGWVLEGQESFDTGLTVDSTSTGASALRVGDDSQRKQFKAILSFNTSALPDSAEILSAKLKLIRGSLTGQSPYDWQMPETPCYVDIKTGTFGAQSLQSLDFQLGATAMQVAQMTRQDTNGTESTGNLNAAGLGAINKTGLTQLRLYFGLDDDNDGTADRYGFYSGEDSINKPILEVTYR
jgi:hypothetical protein